MASITFRTDEEIDAIVAKGQQETGLTVTDLCQVALLEYVAREKPQKIQLAHGKHKVRRLKRRAAA